MKTLVVGGAGYIGLTTSLLLADEGHVPIVLDTFERSKEADIKGLGIRYYNGDYGDKKTVMTILQEEAIDSVIVFAAYAYVGESGKVPLKYYNNNCAKMIDFVSVLVEYGMLAEVMIPLVFSSSCATYGIPKTIPISESESQLPINPYGWTKLMGERILNDISNAYDCIRVVALRYFNACGAERKLRIGENHDPETHLVPLAIEAVLNRRPLYVFGNDYNTVDGTCIRDYIHVSDLAKAHVMALIHSQGEKSKSFDAFNLGTGTGYSVRQVICAIENELGLEMNIVMSKRRQGDPDILVADSTKAQKIMGWNPTESQLENIIRTHVAWLKKRV